jgi:hypothetical protein
LLLAELGDSKRRCDRKEAAGTACRRPLCIPALAPRAVPKLPALTNAMMVMPDSAAVPMMAAPTAAMIVAVRMVATVVTLASIVVMPGLILVILVIGIAHLRDSGSGCDHQR